MMKTPTSAQWLEIAKAFDRPFEERPKRHLRFTGCLCCSPQSRMGLCNTFDEIEVSYKSLHGFMKDANLYGYWWPTNDTGDRQRAFFCMMMSAITAAGDMDDMIEEV